MCANLSGYPRKRTDYNKYIQMVQLYNGRASVGGEMEVDGCESVRLWQIVGSAGADAVSTKRASSPPPTAAASARSLQ